MSKAMHLLHKTGTTIVLDVQSANVRQSALVPGGFHIAYRSDTSTILFLRSQEFDAAILCETTDGDPE